MRYAHLHGFASSSRSLKGTHLRAFLARRGIDLLLPDLNRPSFAALSPAAMLAHLDGMHEIYGRPRWRLIGSSLGGWLAARWAEVHPERVDALVLLCPAFDLTNRWPALLPEDGLSRWRRDGTLPIPDADGRIVPVSFRFYEEMKAQHAFPRVCCPTTIVHGTEDDRVPIELSRRYAAENPGVTLIEVHDGHALLESLPVIEKAVLERFGIGAQEASA
jgi:pimeloyl-ACP methyl ester carboxylesterase